MKKIPFVKMAGAGNDFVVIDAPKNINLRRLARKICHRTDGIGADGLLVLGKSRRADYRMRIINADGSEAEMCGNGARCMVRYIAVKKNDRRKRFTIQTLAGIVTGTIQGRNVTVTLSDPKDFRGDLPLEVSGRTLRVNYIDTGVPHVVIYVDGLKDIDVNGIAPQIRFHKAFKPRGANVNFVEQLQPKRVAVRTYERGVEQETRACGTGSVAVALITHLKSRPSVPGRKKDYIKVLTASGEVLTVGFTVSGQTIQDVTLTGSARFIAEGRYLLG